MVAGVLVAVFSRGLFWPQSFLGGCLVVYLGAQLDGGRDGVSVGLLELRFELAVNFGVSIRLPLLTPRQR